MAPQELVRRRVQDDRAARAQDAMDLAQGAVAVHDDDTEATIERRASGQASSRDRLRRRRCWAK